MGQGFKPQDNTSSWQLGCGTSQLFWNGGGSGIFVAPVHLPSGVSITRFTLGYSDFSATDYSADLVRFSTAAAPFNVTLMASAVTAGSAGRGEFSDTSIVNPLVLNDSFAYYVRVQLAGAGVAGACLDNVEVAFTR